MSEAVFERGLVFVVFWSKQGFILRGGLEFSVDMCEMQAGFQQIEKKMYGAWHTLNWIDETHPQYWSISGVWVRCGRTRFIEQHLIILLGFSLLRAERRWFSVSHEQTKMLCNIVSRFAAPNWCYSERGAWSGVHLEAPFYFSGGEGGKKKKRPASEKYSSYPEMQLRWQGATKKHTGQHAKRQRQFPHVGKLFARRVVGPSCRDVKAAPLNVVLCCKSRDFVQSYSKKCEHG